MITHINPITIIISTKTVNYLIQDNILWDTSISFKTKEVYLHKGVYTHKSTAHSNGL